MRGISKSLGGLSMSTFINYIKDLLAEFKKDNVPILAAAQAYYYLLSIFPLLIVCFAIIPYFKIEPNDAIDFMNKTLPSEMASIFEENIISLIQTPKGGLLTFGIIAALWSASGGINAFIKAVNEAYEIDETRSFIHVRLLALTLTIGMIISLVVAILLLVFGNVILGFIKSFLGISGSLVVLLQIARWTISILVITGLLILLYRFAPNKKLPLKHIMPGALTTSILWLLISLGFSLYASNFGSYSVTYGSLGGIIVLMIWFFLTGLTLMIGAEINIIHQRRNKGTN